MTEWSTKIEEELALLIKDWLKAQGRTQADLKNSLQAVSTRMPSLLEALKKEYLHGGIANVAKRLCLIEAAWANNKTTTKENKINMIDESIDPFDQLDLLLEELREDCEA